MPAKGTSATTEVPLPAGLAPQRVPGLVPAAEAVTRRALA